MNNSITFSANKLRPLLAPLYKNINTSTVLQILECFYILVSEGKMKITASNLETTTTLTVDVEYSSSFACVISAKGFTNFVRNAIEDTITLTRLKEKCVLETGGFVVNISTENPDNYPKIPVVDDAKTITLDAKEIMPLISSAMYSVSNDDLRPAMTGIYLHDDGNNLMVISTDAHRMYFNSVMKTPAAMQGAKAIIRKGTALILLLAIKKGDITIRVNNDYISFKSGDYEVIGRLIDANFPDYKQVLQRYNFKFAMKRKQLSSFIRIAKEYLNASTQQIHVEVSNTTIVLFGSDVDFEMDCRYSMPVYNLTDTLKAPLSFGLNINFWEQSLRVNKKDEYVTIEHSLEPRKSMVIDGCVLLMPIMLNQ